MKIILRCFIVIILLFFIETINAQISAVNSQTASQLVQNVLLGNGVTATNVKLNGTSVGANVLNAQIGYFDKATSNFPITKGIVMTSGLVSNIPGTANSFASSATGSGSDLDLVSISGVNIFDQVVLEFDFVATGDSMQFKYMFASEEYPEFVGGGVNDAFGFFLSGPGIFGSFLNGAVNLAHLPGGIVPVSINTVNQNINTSFYTSNANNFYGVTTKMDGMTVVMAALSALQCGETYHIKLALGDGGDAVYDSAVFLEAESFKSNVVKIEAESNLSNNFTDTLMAEGCVSTNLVFTRPTIYKDSPQKFYLNYGGTADPQLDFINLLDTIYFPSGEDTVSFLVTPMDDGLIEPMEYLDIFGYSVTICGDTIYDSIRLYIVDHYDLTYTLQ
ncbi:MAG: choice-of-anchor L domain-containing protein, partial [Bacteroidetes bacterium]|nr:choice-of-anchor L domain-containing protein [Bacteroidota bacterium]